MNGTIMARAGLLPPAILLLAACAASSETRLADGRVGYVIDCSGANTWGQCHRKAGELCGQKGYEVVSERTNQDDTVVAGQDDGYGSSGASRTLTIACKP